MWYVLQTITGQEEELVHMIKEVVPTHVYSDCFVAYYERVWRRQQQSIVHVERLFPGYVFIVSDNPNELYLELKRVPAMSKLISAGKFEFLPIEREEEAFFHALLTEERIVRLSYVETDGRGNIYRISGPLKQFADQVVKFQFKKRYAIIRFHMLGMEKTGILGIILREDVRQEIAYGKVEAPITVPEQYIAEGAPAPRNNKDDASSKGNASSAITMAFDDLFVGDRVEVTSGMLESVIGVVWRVKKTTVEVGVRLFGQDMAMEVAKEDVRRLG